MKGWKKKAELLVGNVVYIILNLVFLAILILFIMKQGAGAVVLEQSYAKQIALLIDSAKPGMVLKINMEDAKELAESNNIAFLQTVKIEDNLVIVQLSQKGGYSYSFFNDVAVTAYPDEEYFIISVNNYK